jgi:hypothetical protein
MDGKPVPERVELPIQLILNPHRAPPHLTPEVREKRNLPPEKPK